MIRQHHAPHVTHSSSLASPRIPPQPNTPTRRSISLFFIWHLGLNTKRKKPYPTPPRLSPSSRLAKPCRCCALPLSINTHSFLFLPRDGCEAVIVHHSLLILPTAAKLKPAPFLLALSAYHRFFLSEPRSWDIHYLASWSSVASHDDDEGDGHRPSCLLIGDHKVYNIV